MILLQSPLLEDGVELFERYITTLTNPTVIYYRPELWLGFQKGLGDWLEYPVINHVHLGATVVIYSDCDIVHGLLQIAVKERRLDPEQAEIHYFEKGPEWTPHIITFDKLGNVRGAPVGFGAWKMQYTTRLLGIDRCIGDE